MLQEELLSILGTAEKLKCNTRHSDTSSKRRESVAEHSWRLTLMAMLLEDEFCELDMNKVLRMCLIHDLGEAFTGDIPSFLKTKEDTEKEDQAFESWVDGFPVFQKVQFQGLLAEMSALQTREARLYKALDKMEAVIQHNEADISSWLPLEYELQLTYGTDEAENSPYLAKLRECIRNRTIEKIEKESKS